MKTVAVVVGTRPEAIKLAPVIQRLQNESNINIYVVSTAQHRRLLDDALELFDISVDHDLDIMRPGQAPLGVFRDVTTLLPPILEEAHPDLILVHGDTTTAFAAALAAFHMGLDVGHVEAGLRTRVPGSPFPEEFNRRSIATAATLHFAPTAEARRNLLGEGVPPRDIFVTGNTIVDSLDAAIRNLGDTSSLKLVGIPLDGPGLPHWDSSRPTVFVTCHRRENQGAPMRQIFTAIRDIADTNPIVQFVFPVHPSPQVRSDAASLLSMSPNILLVEPLNYMDTVSLLRRSICVFTDSGGLQEEAAILGKRAMVFRDFTERPETVTAGSAILVGSDRGRIVTVAEEILNKPSYPTISLAARTLLGDGHASQRICDVVREHVGA